MQRLHIYGTQTVPFPKCMADMANQFQYSCSKLPHGPKILFYLTLQEGITTQLALVFNLKPVFPPWLLLFSIEQAASWEMIKEWLLPRCSEVWNIKPQIIMINVFKVFCEWILNRFCSAHQLLSACTFCSLERCFGRVH